MPIRQPGGKFLGKYGRRPVLAVVDTGVRAHPWLDVKANPNGGYDLDETDGFVAVDFPVQDAILQVSEQAAEAGDLPREPIDGPWDTPVTADPLVGELDTDTGHGTFIAGLVRQIVPDARVLALRVMHSDGVVYEGDLLCALGRLAARVALAQAGTGTGQGEVGSMARMVDVVSLSLGYFDETADDVSFSTGLLQVIDLLLSLGVPVVAAAGNYATSRKFYPAAFTQPPPPPGQVPLISVGALNPNGSKALFSDGGRWVTAWAPGAAVASTFPVDLNGSRSPQLRMPAHPANEMPPGVSLPPEREALDPDDYRGGYAIWSGTSFSAPLVAAHITKAVLDGASGPALGLGLPGAQAATARAQAALAALRARQGLDGPG
jgi:subtilisin family serine protease